MAHCPVNQTRFLSGLALSFLNQAEWGNDSYNLAFVPKKRFPVSVQKRVKGAQNKRRFYNSPYRTLSAELIDPSGKQLLAAIEKVRLVSMDQKGMVIEGVQTFKERDTKKGRKHHFTQRWLCKLPGVPTVLNTEKLLKRSAARLNAHLVSGFDPADDDRAD